MTGISIAVKNACHSQTDECFRSSLCFADILGNLTVRREKIGRELNLSRMSPRCWGVIMIHNATLTWGITLLVEADIALK